MSVDVWTRICQNASLCSAMEILTFYISFNQPQDIIPEMKCCDFNDWKKRRRSEFLWHRHMTEGWKARRILNGLGFELSVTMVTNEIWGGMHSPYLSALDFWHSRVWNLEFDELDFFQVWTGFLQTTQTVKIQFKLGKNTVQTRKKYSSSNWIFQTGELQKSSADR